MRRRMLIARLIASVAAAVVSPPLAWSRPALPSFAGLPATPAAVGSQDAPTAPLDLAARERRWRAETLASLPVVRQRQLDRVDSIEREAWAGWESSKAGPGDPDHRYLEIIQWCITERMKLFGLAA